nr:DUF6196 family protein [uncultured Halomonas sp.]
MVNISRETPEATIARLKSVIKETRLTVYSSAYIFEEFPLAEFRDRADESALALVRDDRVWSQLVERDDPDAEQFAIWRFHFPEGADNSGFVGWLGMHLKTRFGTGVFVVCGQNSGDGGIFDYWGCPWALRDGIIAEIERLARPVPASR